MAKRRPRDLLLAAGLIVGTIAFGGGTTARAQGTIAFRSTPVPGAIADALAAGPDGSLWSVNQTANTISHVTFPDLHVATFNVPAPSAGLTGITAGPDGNMWFTESATNKIGRIDGSGTITEFPVPSGSPPPQRIFPGPNGTLWATACPFLGVSCGSFIVQNISGLSSRLLIQTPSGKDYSADQCTPGADGNVWCFGNEESFNPFNSVFTIARIDANGGYSAFAPATGFQGAAILTAPDGNVWYTWLRAGTGTGVARVSPSGVITEYAVPTGKPQSWIFGLAVGADGNLYFPDRQTSILYELVLSTATDAGTATINSGTISIDIPEYLVAVSNQSGTAGIRMRNGPRCPETTFIIRSGGSIFGSIVFIETASATMCTDLFAFVTTPVRGKVPGTFTGEAGCTDKANSPDPALDTSLTLKLPAASVIDSTDANGVDIDKWGCTVQGSGDLKPIIECTAPSIQQDKTRKLKFVGAVTQGRLIAICGSSTPDSEPDNNRARSYQSEPPSKPPSPVVSVENGRKQ